MGDFQNLMNEVVTAQMKRELKYVNDFLELIGCKSGHEPGFIFVVMPGDKRLLQGGMVCVLGPDGILHHLRVVEVMP